MVTVVIFALAFLGPVVAALGLILWRRFICHDEAAGAAVVGVALGLIGGLLMGGAVTGVLIGVVLLMTRARR